ncbi:protoglobin domain-containing protein [Gammaproteobacteria bacterium]|nr:protoglobin domain-containing protein [Gammaproteobacteria bacterium]
MPYKQSSAARLSLANLEQDSINELLKARYFIEPAVLEMLDKLYVRVLADAESGNIPCDVAEVDRLRQQLKVHWSEALFQSKYDSVYREKTFKICRAHARVGLTPDWYIDSYSQILCQLIELILENHSADGKPTVSLVKTISKIFFLEMDLMVNSYLESKDQAMKQMLLKSTELREDIWRFSDDLNSVVSNLNATAETLAEDIQSPVGSVRPNDNHDETDWTRAQQHSSELLDQARQLKCQTSRLEEHLKQLPMNEKLYLSEASFFSWLKPFFEKRYYRNKNNSLTP